MDPIATGVLPLVVNRATRLAQTLKGLKAASDRFNYDYSEEELAEIATRVTELAEAVPVVHAVMNNNYEDQGQRNAKTLKALLDRARSPA